MTEATTHSALQTALVEAHRARSLEAWRMIGALRTLPIRLVARHEKRAAQPDGPCMRSGCPA